MRNLVVALVLLAIGAVTSSAAQEQERRCRESNVPRKLPAAGVLLDSARAVGELDTLPIPAAGTVLTLIYNEEDSLPDVRPLDIDSTSARAAGILAGSARPLRPNGLWTVRVRMVGGTAPALTVQRSMYCPPVLVGVPARNQRVVVETRGQDRQLSPGTIVKIIAEARINESGGVDEVRIVHSSGVTALDDEIIRDIRLRRFLPALLDGFPVPGWYRTDGHHLQ
jgi:hypothetical protein